MPANKLNQLKKSPIAVVRSNLEKCADTILVSFFIGFIFYSIELLAEKHALNGTFVAPFSSVIKNQMDVMSLVLFYAVVIFYAGAHMILTNVAFIGDFMDFIGIEQKMDVFYLFVLQCVAAVIGVRVGMMFAKLCFSTGAAEGAHVVLILIAAALVLIGIWYIKGINDRTAAFAVGAVLIAVSIGLYVCMALSIIQKFVS
jgi:hypothetical protein